MIKHDRNDPAGARAGRPAMLRATGAAGAAIAALLVALGFAGGLWLGQRESLDEERATASVLVHCALHDLFILEAMA
jgi:hypothetical protein